MLRADARTETLRRGGVFGGAALLALWCTDWIQHYLHPSASIPVWHLSPPWLFAAVGAYGAVVLHDRFLKAALIVFTLPNLASIIFDRHSSVMAAFSNALIGTFAVLLLVAGARHRTRKDLLLAVIVFAGAMMFSLSVREYALYVISGRSVTYGHGGSR
jgi:hypothetical protein